MKRTLRRLAAGASGAALGAAVLQVQPPAGPDRSREQPDEPNAVWAPAAATNFQAANRPVDRPIDMVVIHDIEGTAEGCVRWFQNPMARVSAHYVIGGTGKIWQQVKERDIAWHAGNSDVNGRSI